MNEDYRHQHGADQNLPLLNQQQSYQNDHPRNQYQDPYMNGLAQNDIDQLQIDPTININDPRLREISLKKKADSLTGELCMAITIILISTIFVIANSDEQCDIPAKMWLSGIMASYIAELILIMFQFHSLKADQRESLTIMALRYLVLVFLTSWLVYGNILYYDKGTEQGCNNGLRLAVFLVLLIGYFEMMKCCCLSLFVCIMVPIFIYAMRRARRPNWMPAPPKFIQELVKTKFNPQANQAQESCPICMVEFTTSDDIVPLPCDEKHYFHQQCIKMWLEKNNNCPLCKKEITKEALKEQKKKFKESKKNQTKSNQQKEEPHVNEDQNKQ